MYYFVWSSFCLLVVRSRSLVRLRFNFLVNTLHRGRHRMPCCLFVVQHSSVHGFVRICTVVMFWLHLSFSIVNKSSLQSFFYEKCFHYLVFFPMSESPSGKREGFQDNATCKREVYCWLEPGLLPHPTQWCRVRETRAQAVTQIYRVNISSW